MQPAFLCMSVMQSRMVQVRPVNDDEALAASRHSCCKVTGACKSQTAVQQCCQWRSNVK